MESQEQQNLSESVYAETDVASPTVSEEEYQELMQMRQVIMQAKAGKSDCLEFLIMADQYAAKAPEVRAQLDELNAKIQENTQALQTRVKEIVEPLGIQGEFSISETAPHYIQLMGAKP